MVVGRLKLIDYSVMTTEISLRRLVRRARSKQLQSKVFISLYEELNERKAIDGNEYVTELLESTEESGSTSNYQVRLVLDLAFSSYDRLVNFWTNLSKISPRLQITYISQLHKLFNSNKLQQQPGLKIEKDIIKRFVNVQFKQYVSQLTSESDKNIISLTNHVVTFAIYIFKSDKYGALIEEQATSQLVSTIVALLKSLKLNQLLNFFILKIKSVINETQMIEIVSHSKDTTKAKVDEKHTSSTTATTVSTSSTFKNLNISSLSPPKLENFSDTQKFIWFSKIMKTWKFDNNEAFLKSFINNFVPQDKRKNPYFITSELIKVSFRGFGYSVLNNEPRYVLFNWKNFIISRIPIILSQLKVNNSNSSSNNNSEEIETLDKAILYGFNSQSDSIIKVLTNLRIGSIKSYDLRQIFIKTLIFNKLLVPSSFQTFFPMESKITHQMIVNELNQFNFELNIRSKFKEKLININGEFTSLEESGLLAYCNSLPTLLEYSYKRQHELSSVVYDIMKDLIQLKQHEKLNRLLLSIFNNIQLLNIIVFNLGPEKILDLLINFIDSENYDVGNDDDENFQEAYSYCGVIILGIILIIETFKIDLSSLQIKNSFIINYINDFYYRLCDNLSNQSPTIKDNEEEDSIIIINYNNLLTDWVNALFDDANDGLSDELIKSIGIKQIYKLIPIVYQQAIFATKLGKIDFNILNNGIDYLSQVFLIPCIINIIKWLLKEILLVKHDNDSIFIKVLSEIIRSNYNKNNSNANSGTNNNNSHNNSNSHDLSTLIFKIIINISGSNILLTLKKLKDWESSIKIKEIIGIITSELDTNYVEIESTLNEAGKIQNLNIVEEVKNHLVNFQQNFDTNSNSLSLTRNNSSSAIITSNGNNGGHNHHMLSPPFDQQTFFFHNYLNRHFSQLVRLLILETQSFQKSNNESTKIFINLSIYLIIMNSINTSEDKKYWKDQLQQQPQSNVEKENKIKKQIKFDQQFNSSMENHYSSIFNDSNSNDSNNDQSNDQVKKEEDQPMDVIDDFSSMLKDVDEDDLMLGEEDDLFNDKGLMNNLDGLVQSNGIENVTVSTSKVLDEFNAKINHHNNLLRQFNLIRLREKPESPLSRTLSILNDKFIEEIDAFYI
ncbi:mediator of RNA polymerase II transcription subunit 5 [Scheffersomyces coipomensis]|uniref:mediator of RNA polymerase II transcription subunit 5 n=1 Tax=Scheffersomyces coipomensis TaxID=1788519 RepID=UPI00315D267A